MHWLYFSLGFCYLRSVWASARFMKGFQADSKTNLFYLLGHFLVQMKSLGIVYLLGERVDTIPKCWRWNFHQVNWLRSNWMVCVIPSMANMRWPKCHMSLIGESVSSGKVDTFWHWQSLIKYNSSNIIHQDILSNIDQLSDIDSGNELFQ